MFLEWDQEALDLANQGQEYHLNCNFAQTQIIIFGGFPLALRWIFQIPLLKSVTVIIQCVDPVCSLLAHTTQEGH